MINGTHSSLLPYLLTFFSAHEHPRSEAYRLVFGSDRDPRHAIRISMLWGAFKRMVQKKYPSFIAVPATTRPPPPPPPAIDSAGLPNGDHAAGQEAAVKSMPTICEFRFRPANTRRRVRIRGLRGPKGSLVTRSCAGAAATTLAASADSSCTASSAEEEEEEEE